MSFKTFSVFSIAIAVTVSFSFSAFSDTASAAQVSQVSDISAVPAISGSSVANPTPEQQIKDALQLAQQGKPAEALSSIQTIKPQVAGQPSLATEYLNTLHVIAQQSEAELKPQVFADALELVNACKQSANFDGRGNAETAYYFMLAVGQLADESEAIDTHVFAELQLTRGSIARNLLSNSLYPADSHAVLALPLIGMAKGYAANKDQAASLQAIQDAAKLDYPEMEALKTETIFQQLPDQAAFQQTVDGLFQTYLVKVKQWSEQEVDQFQAFKYNFRVDDVAGGSLAKTEFEDKILVVDFWATWCPPCREEIPHFVKLQKDFGKQDVQVLGISMDSPDDPSSARDVVRKFMKANKVNYPCGLGTDDLTAAIPGDVKLPTTLFIDRAGNVRYMATGYQDHAKLSAITSTLLNEPQPVRTTLRNVRSLLEPH